MPRFPHRPAAEPAAALACCVLAALLATRRLLRPDVYSDDAFVHQFWLWRHRDPGLFTDGLTAELRESARYPDGYEALFRLVTQVASPIAFGEWLGAALMALSAWLVFLVVRELADWRPGAWIAGALFLALVDIHRFHGGFPRAFVHPVVLLTVLLALRRHHLAAALVAGGGALLYPPAALLAVGVLALSALRWSGEGRPRIDARRLAFAGLALAIAAGAVLAGGSGTRVLSAAEARAFPEFGEHGPLHFFVGSTLEYLRQNRSGFDLRGTGSILVLAALALLAFRPGNLRLLREEVLALPVVALAAYGAAQAVLFQLYLPHRYTYPLVAFGAIVVGVTLRPTWTATWARRSRWPRAVALLLAPAAVAGLAVYAFPLGPMRPFAAAPTAAVAGSALLAAVAFAALARRVAARRLPALGAALTGLLLLGAVLAAPDRWARGTACPTGPAVAYLASLPKDAVVAGDPHDLKCLPATARRAVVISTQLAPSYEAAYFRQARARMFATLRALYGPSPDALAELRTRYGVTHLWVRRNAVARELAGPGTRWRAGRLPYGRYVRDLVAAATPPAALRLPPACRRWRQGAEEVYDVACVARAPER